MIGSEPVGTCSACGTALPPGAPFCGTCGASVPPTERAAVVAARAAARDAAAWAAAGDAAPVPATPGRRVAALLVDQAFCLAVTICSFAALVVGANVDVTTVSNAATLAEATALFGVPFAVACLVGLAQLIAEGHSGATIGNAALSIRTVRVDTGRPPGFGRAFLRRFIEGLGSIVVIGSYVVAASSAWDRSPHRQGWQDKAAGTTMVMATSLGGRPAASTSSARSSRSAGRTAPSPGVATGAARSSGVNWPPITASMPGTPASSSDSDAPLASPRPTGLISDVPGFAPAGADADGALIVESARVPSPAPSGAAESVPAPAPSATGSFDRTRSAAPKPVHAVAYLLAFDTGDSLVVSGPGLIGRNPAPGPGEVVDHVIPIADPDRSVSKTHLAFGIGPDGFWVLDRGSTNGTTVAVGGARTEATAGTRVTIPVGATVELGDRSFKVSPA